MEKLKKFFSWSYAPKNSIGEGRANNFNIIRFIASIMVIYGHMSSIMGLPVHCIYKQAVSTIAVKIFFIISGYLITKSFLSDSNFGRYMIKRIFRIFPGLIAVVLFAICIVGPIFTTLPLSEYFTNSGTTFYLKNITMFPVFSLPGVFTDYTYPSAVNGSLWSLPAEFAMYLLLPLVVVIFKKLRILKIGIFTTAVVFEILYIVKLVLFPQAVLIVYGNNLLDWLPLIPFFFMGSLLSFEEYKKFLNLQFATAMLVIGSLISLSFPKTEVMLFFVLPYFIISFALCDKPLFCGWFKKCDFSYGLYLYGFIIQQIFFNILKKFSLSLNVMFALCLIGTMVCAIISWYLVEKPMQKLGNKLVKRLKIQVK